MSLLLLFASPTGAPAEVETWLPVMEYVRSVDTRRHTALHQHFISESPYPIPDPVAPVIYWIPFFDVPSAARKIRTVDIQSFALEYPVADAHITSWIPQVDDVPRRQRRDQPQNFAFDFFKETPVPPSIEYWQSQVDVVPRKPVRHQHQNFAFDFTIPAPSMSSWQSQVDAVPRKPVRHQHQNFAFDFFKTPPVPFEYWHSRFDYVSPRDRNIAPYESPTGAFVMDYPINFTSQDRLVIEVGYEIQATINMTYPVNVNITVDNPIDVTMEMDIAV
jgi:hypothetical protein